MNTRCKMECRDSITTDEDEKRVIKGIHNCSKARTALCAYVEKCIKNVPEKNRFLHYNVFKKNFTKQNIRDLNLS